MKPQTILSLFNGMSCGRLALAVKEFPINKYYSSEIDKYANQVAAVVTPEIVNLGDIEAWQEWDIEQPDIIIAGSPCQGFSFAGKRLNFEDPRSKLFFTFIDILKHYKPKYFLLENVKMAKEHNDIISRILGELYPECIEQTEMFQEPRLEPMLINSALVSAQNRERLYWTNIPGIVQPEDRGIYLRDIIESGEVDRDKSVALVSGNLTGGTEEYLKRRYFNKSMGQIVKCGAIRGRPIENPKSRQAGLETKQMLEIRDDEKTNCLTSVQKDNVVIVPGFENNKSEKVQKRIKDNIKELDEKGNSMTACIYKGAANNGHTVITQDNITWRKLTPRECGRLQTVPEPILDMILNCGVSNSQLYKMFGNGWTVDVIAHILGFIPELKNQNQEPKK